MPFPQMTSWFRAVRRGSPTAAPSLPSHSPRTSGALRRGQDGDTSRKDRISRTSVDQMGAFRGNICKFEWVQDACEKPSSKSGTVRPETRRRV